MFIPFFGGESSLFFIEWGGGGGNPDASFNSRLFLSHVAFLQSQWPENRTLDFNTLRDLNNFCWRNGKWLEIPYVQAFFALHSQASLCESCSTSQILLAHSGPHPPNTMSPNPCSDFSSSFDPLRTTAHPLLLPIPLQPLQIHIHNLHLTPPPSLLVKCGQSPPPPPPPPPAAPNPPPLLVPEASSETSAPPSTPRVPGLYPDLPISPPCTRSGTTLKQETSQQDPTPFPTPPLPLWEVARAKYIVQVYVPYSLNDLCQTEQHLGSFSSDPDNYLKEFRYLTQSYDLIWHGIYIILSSTLLPEEKERVWQVSQAHADEIHRTEGTKSVGVTAVHRDYPNRDYQAGRPG